MNIELLIVDKLVDTNQLQPVTNSISFRKGMTPTPDGLFSAEIFGVNSTSRKRTYAYIDLKKHYLNPKAYITLKSVDRKFAECIYGTEYFKIVEGELVKDEKGQTGIEFLYNNWSKFKFKKNDSRIRSTRVDVLTNNSRSQLFISKFPVMPAFYRDVNTQGKTNGKVKVHEINDLYNNIIRNVEMVESASNFDFMVHSLEGKVQDTIVEIYNLLKEKVQGKNGLMRKFVMGSSVDYSVRTTMTATAYHTNTYEEQPIRMNHTGVPLAYCISMFTPFIIHWLTRWFKTRLESNYRSFPYVYKKGNKEERVYLTLEDPEVAFNSEYIEKRLERWIETPSSRFEIVRIQVKKRDMEKYGIKEGNEPMLTFTGYRRDPNSMQREMVETTEAKGGESENLMVNRPLTWTDLLYQAAVEVTADKHVQVTRYPLLDYLGVYFAKIHVLSTRNTQPMVVGSTLYPYYPVVDPKAKGNLDSLFIDSLKQTPLYLKGLDGDHDGDQTTTKGVMSIEANQDAEKIMHSKTNLITIDGHLIRTLGNEAAQTLYSMTRFKKPVNKSS